MKIIGKILKYTFGTILFFLGVIMAIYWRNDIPFSVLKEKYATADSKFKHLAGAEIHYQDLGNKNDSLPLVLVHGTGASLHTWAGWVEELQSTKRIITLDLPAYGLTGPNNTADYSTKKYVETVDSLLQKLNVKRCIIGGNSLGGNVSWNYTVAHPNKVAKLILVDAAGYNFKSKSVPIAFKLARVPVLNNLIKFLTPRFIIEKSVRNVYADKSKVTETLIDRYFDLTLREGNRGAFIERMANAKNTIVSINASDLVKKITIPTLILWGGEDGLITTESAQKFHDDLPNDTLVIMKNLGHVPMEEDPKASVAVVKAFLKIK
jgi:pimeloyl-ACP methyl ester carboxylesterase